MSFTALTARVLKSAVQVWYLRKYHDSSKVFDSWILRKALRSKVIADLPLRSARPYMKYCSYSTRIRMKTRKRRPLTSQYRWLCCIVYLWLNDGGPWLSCGEKIQVSVDGWLKHSFSNKRKRTLRQVSLLS